MQTAAIVNFEQVLFRFGRNWSIRSHSIPVGKINARVAEGVPGKPLLPGPVVAAAAGPLALQPNGMPGLEAGRTPSSPLPARRPGIP